jgi:hypothetical protein
MAKKMTLNELGAMVEHVVKHMATKEDLENLATKEDVAELKATLDEHTRDLTQIKSDVATNLDHRLKLEVRVTKIEKHLGLDKNIAA